jgi:hypothetical protein
MIFNKRIKVLHTLEAPTQDEIRQIPQFYRADFDMVYRLGGDFLRQVLKYCKFESHYNYLSIDTRVHMLMPGWYPCIPGWHCDDFYRPTGGQPDLENVMTKAMATHHLVVAGDTSFTQFLCLNSDLPSPSELQHIPGNLYAKYDDLINAKIEAGTLKSFDVKNGEIIQFSPLDFHRGVQATRHGWRVFARTTQSNHYQPQNEIRTQTQVYLPVVNAGW